MDNKKVSIIGSNSFLAKGFISRTIEIYDLLLFGKKFDKAFRNLPFWKFYYPEFDLPYEELLCQDTIIIFACAGVQQNSKENNTQNANLLFPKKLISFLQKNNYEGKLITFGSHFEIGPNKKNISFTETEIASRKSHPKGSYSEIKNELTSFIATNPNDLKHTHLILPNIFGPNENENRLIPYLINNKKNKSSIFLSDPLKTRQFLHVYDLADLIVNIITNEYTGIFNVKSANTYTIGELARLIYPKEKISFGKEMRDDGMHILILNTNKINKTIDWEPKIFLPEYLAKF